MEGYQTEKIEKRAVQDIKNNKMWHSIYILLKIVFPALQVLCSANSNQTCMYNLYYIYHSTTQATIKLSTYLNNEDFILSPESDNDSDDLPFDTPNDDVDDNENDINDNIE